MSLSDTIKKVEDTLPEYGWLVRSYSTGYFANITSPDFKAGFIVRGGRFVSEQAGKAYYGSGISPDEALQMSLELALADLAKQHDNHQSV